MKVERAGAKPFSVRLKIDWRHLVPAGAMALLSAVLLWYCRRQFLQEDGSLCLWFTALYGAVAAGGVLLCLVRIELLERQRHVVDWLAVLLMPAVTFLSVDKINGTFFLEFDFFHLLANYICYLTVYALLYGLTRRAWASVLVGGAFFIFYGVANYFVTQFRNQPILPWDIQAAGTAMDVTGGYAYVFSRPIALAILLVPFLTVLTLRLGISGRDSTTRRFRLTERLCALAAAGALVILLFPVDLLSHMGISVWAWNQKTSTKMNGVLPGFLANLQFLMVEKPDDYSAETIEELRQQLANEPEPEPLGDPGGKLPTIIVVMNESLTDFSTFSRLEFTQDNMPYIHSLQQSGQVIWGTAYASVFGGDTCNSEYEFLTGNSLYLLPSGCKPFQQYLDKEQTALPLLLKGYGYSCNAIHPGTEEAWQRDTAYPRFGFEDFTSMLEFHIQREHQHNNMTGDRSCYEEIVYQYEMRKAQSDAPQFLFNVTIQNHGGFEDSSYPTTVQVKGQEGRWPQAEQYLSLTKASDDALPYLIDYFDRQEEPVVILVYGDHWPKIEEEFISAMLGVDVTDDDIPIENRIRQYQVPFFIWANYPLQGQYVEPLSLNCLSGLLLRAAGLKGTGYTRFIENDLRQQLPVLTAIGAIDRSGVVYKVGEKTPYEDLLDRYEILQYNNIFDETGKVREIFTKGE